MSKYKLIITMNAGMELIDLLTDLTFTIDNVNNIPFGAVWAVSNSLVFVDRNGQVAGNGPVIYMDVPFDIKAVDGGAIAGFSYVLQVIKNEPTILRNPSVINVQSLEKGKMYAISPWYASALGVTPDVKVAPMQTLNDWVRTDWNNAPDFFWYFAFEKTSFNNVAGDVPVIQFEVDANAAYNVKQIKEVNQQQRQVQFINNGGA